MAISGDYPSPVMVNGYSCKNCTDVDYAKKHIDPAHPKDGPYGVAQTGEGKDGAGVVAFGGRLSGPATLDPASQPRSATGTRLDISA